MSTPPPNTGSLGFPTSIEEFQNDPRISWSRLDNKWSLETEEGAEWHFEEALKRWVPVLDESLAEQQQKAYAIAGVDESEPAVKPKEKKRKNYTGEGEDADEAEEKAKKKAKPEKKPQPPRQNTAVYITNLPLDTTEAEIKDVFSKYGVISEEIDTGKPRIKLYRNEDGTLKGDALVIYFRPESVNLAINMLDDSPLRIGGGGMPIRVQAADFSYKQQKEVPTQTSKKEKKKIIAKTQRLNNKLADWDDDDPAAIKRAEPNKFGGKVVVLKHMFTLQELEEDPTALLDLKEDIREECEKLGEVTNVVLYDQEEDGVVTVRFKEPAAAMACVQMMAGRFFAGQQVEAYIADGSEKFKKHTKNVETAEEEEAERLEKFGSWLESEQA
ncbi:nuclear mRNA splicing factor-associated protein [Pyronema omphalodes]|nr:nuclear mRNA splicing factor-associated protein [Pyronema omphalodes]